jgi:hypothetical protein
MPRIVTTLHDPVALATTCRRLGLDLPAERAVNLGAEEVFGWVVCLAGVRFPIVCDTLTGLVAYHPRDGVQQRYGHIMRFLYRCYDVQAEWRRLALAQPLDPSRSPLIPESRTWLLNARAALRRKLQVPTRGGIEPAR